MTGAMVALSILWAATALLAAQPSVHIFKINTPRQKGVVIGVATGFCGRLKAFDKEEEGSIDADRVGPYSSRWGEYSRDIFTETDNSNRPA